jgi:hypothetical protein
MTHAPILALALAVAAQTATAPMSNGPPWLTAVIGAAIAIGGAVAGWFGAKTRAEKSIALANTINAIPTAWNEVLRANPGIPNGQLIAKVLQAAAAFGGHTLEALTETEKAKAAAAVASHAPTPTALATLAAAQIADAKAKTGA